MKNTLYMIGNAHLDPVWLWDWREGFQENKATLKSALDRMDEFDDFVFTSSSAQFYQWVEENAPELFERIKARVREGRWKICGGWWVQPDCNIPCGESFARQALISQNYFYDKFGVIAHTGYCVDSFGHNAMLPQLLKKSGMDHYVFMRPAAHEKTLPANIFFWEAPDGSRVTTFRILLNSYGTFEHLEEFMDRCAGEFTPEMDRLMCFYGVGNHGGGPTVENIRTIRALKGKKANYEAVMSDPDSYFEAIRGRDLPVVRGELQHHAPGCYTAESMIKAMNRKAENALLSAEKFDTLAAFLGKPASKDNMDRAWKDVLFNQFHDILAGSAIEPAYEDSRNQLGEAVAIADRCKNSAIQSISFDIDIPKNVETYPIVVFNPHSWAVTTPVEFEEGIDRVTLSDRNGNPVPFQYVDAVCRVLGRKRVTFLAEVPALGYAVYYLHVGGLQKNPPVQEEPWTLENEFLKVEFDRERGTVSSLYNKRTGRETLAFASRAAVIEDLTDTWGHSLKKLDHEIGEFRLVSARVADCGSVRKSVRFISKYGNSTLTQTFSLFSGEDQLRVDAQINWLDHRKAVKLYFPVDAADPKAVCEIPYGSVEKNREGFEEPMQRWADLSGKGCGLSVVNNCKYGVDFTGSTIGVTVLRSPVFTHHDPYPLTDGEEYNYMEQGLSRFGYLLKPHAGDWREAGTVREAELFNQPLTVVPETFHAGSLPQEKGFLTVSAKNIIMSALKKSLRGSDTILRLYESEGKQTEAEICLFGRKLKTSFGPCEVKTLALSADGAWREVSLIEWDSGREA